MLLSRDWQDFLDNGMNILGIAPDIAGVFDQVWDAGLLEKLCAKGIKKHLMLMSDYFQGRTLHVVINGQQSMDLPVGTSVPQETVLGPVLYKMYISDLL